MQGHFRKMLVLCELLRATPPQKEIASQRTPWWGGKRWGWKTSRMTPLPKRGFGPPLVRYVFHPQMSVLCFSYTKIHDRLEAFWRAPKNFGRARPLVRFPPTPPPYVLHTPLDGRNRAIVIAESLARVIAAIRITSVRWRSYLPQKTQNLVLVDPAFIAL